MSMRWPVSSTVAAASLAIASSAAAQTPAAAPPAPAYEDHLIEGGNLAPAETAELAVYNSEGLPRSWRVDGFLSRTEQGPTRRYENGMVLSARLDTLEYGAFTVDATVRGSGSQGIATLWQRAMPFDRGWIANNGLGMLNTPMIDMARQQFRFYLPTFPIAGASTEWIRQGSMQLQASIGEPGTYNGLRLSGFSGLGGQLLTAGAQWNAARDVQVGAQVIDARDVQAGLDTGSGAGRTSARTVYGGWAWHDATQRLQINALDSQAGAAPHRMGIWADGETAAGRLRHNYGAFRFDHGLTWGYTPVNGDLQGAYYRVNYSSLQWTWSGGVDSVGSVTGQGLEGVFLTGNARYQANRSLGIGGGMNLRHSASDAGSVFGFVDKLTSLGTTRVQVDAAGTRGGRQDAQQLSIDQAWATRVGLRLSTTLSVSRERTPDTLKRRGSIAAFGGIDLTNSIAIDGSIRWGREWDESARTTTNGRYANVGLVWRITPRWSLLATYYDNRVEFPLFTGIAPVIPVEPAIVTPKDRAMFLTVRYEDRAGTPMAPLGGAPGAGAGTLAGYIFYDANDDGRRGANEQGAANVTVVLDGRFGTRTGNDGRFEFPLVTSGPHSIMVIPDNLALPYAISDEGKREVVIRTRETTTLEIAAQRVR